MKSIISIIITIFMVILSLVATIRITEAVQAVKQEEIKYEKIDSVLWYNPKADLDSLYKQYNIKYDSRLFQKRINNRWQ